MRRSERADLLRLWKEEKRLNRIAREEDEAARAEQLYRAQSAEESGYGLWRVSTDPLTGRDATDLAGEVRAALVWCKLLKIENPVVEGKTFLVDLIRRLYYEWQHQGFFLFNPVAQRFSDTWRFEPQGGTFAKCYEPVEGADTLLLKASDFADPVVLAIQPDIPKKSDAEKEHDVMQRIQDQSVKTFFSATPGDGSDKE